MYFYLYKITNLINDKIYIGVHKTENLNDGYMGSGKILKFAIKKYGLENFYKEIIQFFESEEEMFLAESLLVDETFCKDLNTYNLKQGGSGGWNFINSSRKNLYGKNGQLNFGLKNLCKGTELKEKLLSKNLYIEWKQKISDSLKKRWAIRTPPFTGKNHSEESRKKISRSKKGMYKGRLNPNFNHCWIYNLDFKKSLSIKKEELNEYLDLGWKKGRVIDFDKFEIKTHKTSKKQKKIPEYQKDIYSHYLSSKSLRETAKFFGISHVMVFKIKNKIERFRNQIYSE